MLKLRELTKNMRGMFGALIWHIRTTALAVKMFGEAVEKLDFKVETFDDLEVGDKFQFANNCTLFTKISKSECQHCNGVVRKCGDNTLVFQNIKCFDDVAIGAWFRCPCDDTVRVKVSETNYRMLSDPIVSYLERPVQPYVKT